MPNLSNYISVPSLSSYRNFVINGDFSVNEFNFGLPRVVVNPTTFPGIIGNTNQGLFTNMWQFDCKAQTGVSVQFETVTDGPTAVNPNLTRSLRISNQVAKPTLSSADFVRFGHRIEANVMAPLQQNVLNRMKYTDSSQNKHNLTRSENPRLMPAGGFGGAVGIWFENGGIAAGPHKLTLDHSSIAFGTGDWTADVWVYLTSLPPANTFAIIFSTRPNSAAYADGWSLGVTPAGGLGIYTNAYDIGAATGNEVIVTNAWHHIAITKKGSILTVFVNGKLYRLNGAFTGKNLSRTLLGIAQMPTANTEAFSGYIKGLRFTKNIARYGNVNFATPTAELTNAPATTYLLLNCNGTQGSTTFTDSSVYSHVLTNSSPAVTIETGVGAKKFGTGGGNFQSQANLTVTGGTVTTIRQIVLQNSFRIEAWIYMTAAPVGTSGQGNGAVIGHGSIAAGSEYWSFGPRADRKLVFYWWTGAANRVVGNTTLNTGQWYHIAVTKEAASTVNGFAQQSVIRLFVDGVEDGAGPYVPTAQFTDLNPVSVGKVNGGYFIGYMDDLRVVGGSIVTNSANFTVLGIDNYWPGATTSIGRWPTNGLEDLSFNDVSLLLNASDRIEPYDPWFTVSFWTKSSVPGNYTFRYRHRIAGGVLGNGTDGQYLTFYTINAANTWEYKKITMLTDSRYYGATGTIDGVYMGWTLAAGSSVTYPSNLANWNTDTGLIALNNQTNFIGTLSSTFFITGVQLEAGYDATPFETVPYQTNLNRCRRYYQKPVINGRFDVGHYSVTLPVEMRTTPTITGTGTVTSVNRNSVRYSTSPFTLSALDAHFPI